MHICPNGEVADLRIELSDWCIAHAMKLKTLLCSLFLLVLMNSNNLAPVQISLLLLQHYTVLFYRCCISVHCHSIFCQLIEEGKKIKRSNINWLGNITCEGYQKNCNASKLKQNWTKYSIYDPPGWRQNFDQIVIEL
jgi:hypothetical protein